MKVITDPVSSTPYIVLKENPNILALLVFDKNVFSDLDIVYLEPEKVKHFHEVELNDFFIEIMKFTREREGKIVKSIESYRILPKEDN
ncbi:hypothetical protein ZYGNAAKF_CDS0144 [Enterococcus phage VRE9_2]